MEPISRQLAEWCAGLDPADVPASVLDAIPARILDTVGLIIAGSGTAAVKIARAHADESRGNPESTLIGSKTRVATASAAMVHAIAAHCHDFDDTFPDSVVHPGSVVIPTAFAVAEARAASSTDFLLAIAVGYEAAARIGAVAGRSFHARNMHATGLVGPMIAATVAGRLYGLSGERMSWAMGLAASMGGGIRAYAKDGGWSKWLHLGWSAHGGIVAANLAARGFRGPEHVLDGGSDLYSVMLHGDQVDRSRLLAGLGQEWMGATAEFKLYPCAHVTQPFISAALAIVEEQRLQAADIGRIECTIAPWAAAIVCEPREAKLRFATELEAIGSLPFQIATAVIDRKVGLESLSRDNRARPDIAALAQRVFHRLDETLGRGFDGAIKVRLKSGAVFSRKAELGAIALGDVRRKFAGLAEPVIGADHAVKVADCILKSPGNWTAVVEYLAMIEPAEPAL